MLSVGVVVAAAALWLALLFGVAVYAERHPGALSRHWRHVYALSLAVHCTSWTFYGTVTQAARYGWPLPPTFLGAIVFYVVAFAFMLRLVRLARESNVRAMRSLPAECGANRRLDHAGVHALWRAACDEGVTINVLIHLDLADELERMLPRHPSLAVVVDHCMYPKGRDGLMGATLLRMLDLARYPNLHAKLTWLVESSDQAYPFADTHALLRTVIDAYGPERCIWGSDFPLELWTPKATYGQHLEVFREQLGLDAAALEHILWRTPGRLYFRE